MIQKTLCLFISAIALSWSSLNAQSTRIAIDDENEKAHYEEYWQEVFEDVASMHYRVNRLMRNLLDEDQGTALLRQARKRRQFEMGIEEFNPSVDVQQTDTEVIVTCDLPGVDASKIDISLQTGMLTIKGQREMSKEHSGEDEHQEFYHMERAIGQFARSVPLPENIDVDQSEANYEDGVLTIRIAKLDTQEDKVVKVAVS